MWKRELRRMVYGIVAGAAAAAAVVRVLHPGWALADHFDYIFAGIVGSVAGGYITDFLIIPWRKRQSSKPQP